MVPPHADLLMEVCDLSLGANEGARVAHRAPGLPVFETRPASLRLRAHPVQRDALVASVGITARRLTDAQQDFGTKRFVRHLPFL